MARQSKEKLTKHVVETNLTEEAIQNEHLYITKYLLQYSDSY